MFVIGNSGRPLRITDPGGATQSDFEYPATTPLPTASCNERTQVLFTGSDKRTLPAPFFYCSQLQLNVQVPKELQGPTARVKVRLNETDTNEMEVQVADADPGIFILDPKVTYSLERIGAVIFATGERINQLVLPKNSPRRGDILSIFATGLGETMPPLPGNGIATPLSQLYTTILPVTASADGLTNKEKGIPWEVLFSGLAPEFVGLYQINVRVPERLSRGAYLLSLTMEGSESRTSNEILFYVLN